MLAATGFAPGKDPWKRQESKPQGKAAIERNRAKGKGDSRAENHRNAEGSGRHRQHVNTLIPYAKTVGLESFMPTTTAWSPCCAFARAISATTLINAIHGGVVGALLEHAGILHLLAETDAAVVPKIVNLSVDYLRPCLAADTFARGTVIKQGRRVANVRVVAWQDAPERPVAAAHAHFLLSEDSR